MKNIQVFLCLIFVAVVTAEYPYELSWQITGQMKELDKQCSKKGAGTFYKPKDCPSRIDFLKCFFTSIGFVDSTTGLLNEETIRAKLAESVGVDEEVEFYNYCFPEVNMQEPINLVFLNQCFLDFFYLYAG